jgi:hypothetical protein
MGNADKIPRKQNLQRNLFYYKEHLYPSRVNLNFSISMNLSDRKTLRRSSLETLLKNDNKNGKCEGQKYPSRVNFNFSISMNLSDRKVLRRSVVRNS